jgi:hypothetical protein
VGGASKGRSGWPVTVVVAQVPFKQVHELSVSLSKPSVGFFELLVGALLRVSQFTHALHDSVDGTRHAADDTRQAEDSRGNLIYPDAKLFDVTRQGGDCPGDLVHLYAKLLEVRFEASTICRKPSLLM